MWLASDPWRTAAAYFDAVAVGYGPAGGWRARRDARLAALLSRAAEASPLYREILAPLGGAKARFADVPPMRKAELMAAFDRWVTDPGVSAAALHRFTRDPAQIGRPFLGRYTVWESSGSSGEPATFVFDAAAMAASDALESARGPVAQIRPWFGLPAGPGGLRMAFVGAIDGHFASIVSLQRARRLNPWLDATLRTFSFLQPTAELVAALNDWQPTVLSSYPSMAWVLAQEQNAGRLRLDVRAVWTGGETLTPAQREGIAQAFEAPVRDSYGASECLTIAGECRSGRLHLNADWVILEPVDEAWRPLPEGEVGATTLLTNLANHVQPILRYDLGDRVRFVPGRCACGSSLPVIEVQGRLDDVLSLRGDDGRLVHLAPLALTTVLEEEAGVFDFELRQRGARSLQLSLGGHEGADARLQHACSALRAWLRTQGLAGVRVDGHRADAPAARGRSGKQQRVRRGGRIGREARGPAGAGA
jgi:phenylacetate-coenzyme A ligase PaaK-like adenylate-forming protein